MDSLYETKPGWWIAHEMARRLGLEAYFPWASPEEHLNKLLEPLQANLGELQATGALAFEGRPYMEDRLPEDGALFATESGKIQLYSKILKQLGFEPVPRYVPVEEPPLGYFRLIYGRPPSTPLDELRTTPSWTV